MKNLNEDLKTGNIKQAYLLYGEEAYLKKQYRDRLTKAVLPEGDTVNYAHYEGKGINVPEIIDLAETMPFFAEKRLIVIEDSGLFKNADAKFADYIKSMPETVCFVFVESEVDKRSKMYKAVKDTGRVVELGRHDEKTLLFHLPLQILHVGSSSGQHVFCSGLLNLPAFTLYITSKPQKLFSYTLGRNEITVADIDAICTTQITNKIFDMIEAVATRQQRKALDYYYDLLALKEPPMRILYLLARQFRLLLQVKDLMNQGADKSTIAKKAGLHPFVAGKYMQQSRSFTMRELKGIMEEAADTEEAVKTGRLSDTMSVELFIVKYSAPKK